MWRRESVKTGSRRRQRYDKSKGIVDIVDICAAGLSHDVKELRTQRLTYFYIDTGSPYSVIGRKGLNLMISHNGEHHRGIMQSQKLFRFSDTVF